MIDFLLPGSVAATTFGGALLLLGSWVAYVVIVGIYNLTLHPLRSYPGPLIWRISRFAWARSTISGTFPFDVLELHKKYGPVVRVAPDELSYTDSSALKPIYGHHIPATEGYSEFDKDRIEFQKPGNGTWSILGAPAPDHSRFRRLLSHSFSEKGMRDMQPRIQSYVESLIKGLRETSGEYINAVEWYNWATFDMIGDLAFGESFHSLERKETDPWIHAIFGQMKAGAYMVTLRRFGLDWLIPYLTPKHLMKLRDLNRIRNEKNIEKRLEQGSGRGDFWDNVIEKSDFEKGTGMTKEEMVSNSGTLVLGGSETTATLLSGTTYLLLKYPDVMKKLQDEVRTSFKNDEEIDLLSVGKLDYMLAVLDEGMRIYPPVPNQGNRVVPKGGAMIAGKWVPEGTTLQVQQYAASRSSMNFTRPDEFIPERWLTNPPAEFANDDRAARASFSLGPRNCIGRNLAYAEMRLILAKVIYNFDMELDKRSNTWIKDQKIYFLWEKTPLWVKLTPAKQ